MKKYSFVLALVFASFTIFSFQTQESHPEDVAKTKAKSWYASCQYRHHLWLSATYDDRSAAVKAARAHDKAYHNESPTASVLSTFN